LNSATEKYLQSGCCSGMDKLLSLLHTEIPYIINADKAAASFSNENKIDTQPAAKVEVSIKPYDGTNATVWKIADYLERNVEDEIEGAYVHGSTATNEMIAYSDFDGVLIAKDECLASPQRIKRLAFHLKVTHQMMLDLDPLQHHGWYIFSEQDLKNYPDSDFPVELFRHAKSLLNKGHHLTFYIAQQNNYQSPFFKLSQSLLKKTSRRCPLTLFEIKALMSEFMLLPALYIEAKYAKGIFKGDSFKAAATDFTSDEWKIMDDISFIRANWDYPVNVKSEFKAWKYRRVATLSHLKHTVAPKELVKEIDERMPGMNAFVKLMIDRIKS
jgi:hypothetical protein